MLDWAKRHKIITGLAVVVLLAVAIGPFVGGDDSAPRPADAKSKADSAGTSKDKPEAKTDPAEHKAKATPLTCKAASAAYVDQVDGALRDGLKITDAYMLDTSKTRTDETRLDAQRVVVAGTVTGKGVPAGQVVSFGFPAEGQKGLSFALNETASKYSDLGVDVREDSPAGQQRASDRLMPETTKVEDCARG